MIGQPLNLLSRLLLPLLLFSSTTAHAATEVPYLEAAVANKTLPPVSERLPETPSQAHFLGKTTGKYGGRMRMLMAKAKDVRMMTVYGYARLVGSNEDFRLEADILKSVNIKEGRIFTLTLRKGHKWSDGQPFTSEDFRFYWEDVANNEDLSPFGPPVALKLGDELPKFSVIDEQTVRYEWSKPNHYFLPSLAAPSPLYLYRPAHYLKQFHKKYTSAEELAAAVKTSNKKNWRKLFLRSADHYKFTNPELPTLQPWFNTTASPSERFIFKRNPYFHRVDPEGNQLPYIDEVEINLASNSLIPAKAGAGESDLQARYIRMDNYPFLKEAQKSGTADINVNLWQTARGSHIALFPNLTSADPVWRKLLRDVRFRRALSMSIDRDEINQSIYFGLALAAGDTALPQSPLYDEKRSTLWASTDYDQANKLLDEIGLTKRDNRGIRLMPDGEPLEILVQSAGESTEESDVLELITDSWKKVGIQLYTKATQREVLRNRVFSGEAHMSIFFGLPNGIPTAEMSPAQLAPVQQDQLQWSQWGRHYETGEGDAPDLPEAQRLLELFTQWGGTVEFEEKTKIWQEMLDIYADQVYSIGIISGVKQPVISHKTLQNVPETGVFNWDPGSFFGVYRPDTFWFANGK